MGIEIHRKTMGAYLIDILGFHVSAIVGAEPEHTLLTHDTFCHQSTLARQVDYAKHWSGHRTEP
jgi:hypothetical protein